MRKRSGGPFDPLGPCVDELPAGYSLCAQIALAGYVICEYCNPQETDKYIAFNCEIGCYQRVAATPPSMQPAVSEGDAGSVGPPSSSAGFGRSGSDARTGDGGP